MYIAIEGVKGSGKSTLIEALPERLRACGLTAALLCPTRAMPAWHPLERAAQQSEDDALRERLYAARSNYHAAKVPADAPLIVGDRSILTSYATRWHRFAETERHRCIARVDSMEHRIGRPDHVLMLNVPLPNLLTRLHQRTERRYGKHKETAERLCATLTAYQEMRDRAPEWGLHPIQWHDINANTTPEQVLNQVVAVICRLMANDDWLNAA